MQTETAAVDRASAASVPISERYTKHAGKKELKTQENEATAAVRTRVKLNVLLKMIRA